MKTCKKLFGVCLRLLSTVVYAALTVIHFTGMIDAIGDVLED